ncbi:MAG: hypothetical protein FWC24_06795 [Treponema sp.]|nr:hypothetical protein [Treponema sp.]
MKIYTLVAAVILCAVPVFSQDRISPDEDFWVCQITEATMFGASGISYGGGLALAYGRGASIGFKAAYLVNNIIGERIDVLELNFLLRYNFFGGSSVSGPFIQLTGGQAFFFRQKEGISIPSEWGIISAGASLGWRFPLGRLFFIEPFVRGGYPYFAGTGLAAGFHW